MTVAGLTGSGSGVYGFTLPFAASISGIPIGTARITDTGSSYYTCTVISGIFGFPPSVSPSIICHLLVNNGTEANWFAPTIPMTIANGDIIEISVTYTV